MAARTATAALVLGLVLVVGAMPAAAKGHLGVFGGLNIANMGGDMDRIGTELATMLADSLGGTWSADKTSRSGAAVGVWYYLPTTATLGLQVEGQYVSRGSGFDITGGGITMKTKFKLDYVEFPVLLRFSPGMSGRTGVVFLVGPVVGFKTKADLEITAGGQSSSGSMSENFKSTTFGALGGVALRVATAPKSALLLQARYYQGLTNALDDPVFDSKSQDFTIMVGMEFDMTP